jgi:LmbE family N-acetylglucosaminyl deacetylase
VFYKHCRQSSPTTNGSANAQIGPGAGIRAFVAIFAVGSSIKKRYSMHDQLRLLCVLAHPDDESLGFGGLLAQAAAEGVATYLVTATRGERGWPGDPAHDPGPAALGRTRAAELHAAGAALGLRTIRLLDYPDGALAAVPAEHAQATIAAAIREFRPDVVVTFGPEGCTGHPDHIAICRFTTAAIVLAAAGGDANAPAHQVQKLYYLAESAPRIAAYDAVFGSSAMTVNGYTRRFSGWPEWAITTRLDTRPYWREVWRAIRCHRSQLPGLSALDNLPDAVHRELWGEQELYCAFSLAPTASQTETDLFAGLRHEVEVTL